MVEREAEAEISGTEAGSRPVVEREAEPEISGTEAGSQPVVIEEESEVEFEEDPFDPGFHYPSLEAMREVGDIQKDKEDDEDEGGEERLLCHSVVQNNRWGEVK